MKKPKESLVMVTAITIVIFFAAGLLTSTGLWVPSDQKDLKYKNRHKAFPKDVWKSVDVFGRTFELAPPIPSWHQWTTSFDEWGAEIRTRKDDGGILVTRWIDPPAGEDLIQVKEGQLYGFVDYSGELVIPPRYERVKHFHNGFSEVEDQLNDGWKVIDKTGAVVCTLPTAFEPDLQGGFLGISKEGYLPVQKKKKSPEQPAESGLYNINDDHYIPLGLNSNVHEFSEGLAKFNAIRSPKWGYINLSGRVVIPQTFDYSTDFADGLAAVLSDHRWSYIDHTGKTVIRLPEDCSYATSFHEGLAAVALGGDNAVPQDLDARKGSKWGFIDRSGRLVIPAKFYVHQMFGHGMPFNCPEFSEGLAHVAIGNEPSNSYGFIDKAGVWTIKPQFKDASEFKNGHAKICYGETGFCHEDWQKHRGPYVGRSNSFRLFVLQYGLINMSRQEVYEHLGKGGRTGLTCLGPLWEIACHLFRDTEIYDLLTGPCGNSYSGVEIRYQNDTVVGYRYLAFESVEPWIMHASEDSHL